MKFLIIYFFILAHIIHAFTPVQTNRFIKPAVNLNEIYQDNKEAFIGFEGTGGFFKDAKLYIINEDNQLEEQTAFKFSLPSTKTSTFFSAHVGNFIGEGRNELVILVADPSIGTKVYVWEINKEGFKRIYGGAHIINPKHPLSQPRQVIQTTNKEKNKDNLTISFGSPNRNIVVLEFDIKNITKENNLAEKFLQNQAGTIFMISDTKKNNEDILVFNSGDPIQSTLIQAGKETKETKKYNFKGTINEIIKTTTGEIAFLYNKNKLFFAEKEETKLLHHEHAYQNIVNQKADSIWVADNAGNLAIYNLKTENNQIDPTQTIYSNFQTNPPLQQVLYLKNKDKIYVTGTTGEKNYFTILNLKEKKAINPPKEEVFKTQTDSLLFFSDIKQTIPIKLDSSLEFLELIILEQPETMELNLQEMSFVWEPSEKNAGNNILKYRVVYNQSGDIIKLTERTGKTKLNKEIKKQNHIKTHVIYVNVPPHIKTDKDTHKIQAGHTIKIPLFVQDENTEQKLTITHKPQSTTAQIINEEFIWEPKNTDQGTHRIDFIVSDGLSQAQTTNTITVDTLRKTTEHIHDFIITTNQEFVLDLSSPAIKKYNQIKGPENAWISKKGVFHWIPLTTQLGHNEILVERKSNQTTENHRVSIFVNAPPVISYRPDKLEYITHKETFTFELKSFDANENQTIFWSLTKKPTGMMLGENNTLAWKANTLDHHSYVVEVSDSINVDVFEGQIYVNEIPKITSTPPQIIQIGETLSYTVAVEDANTQNPKNWQEKNKLMYSLNSAPPTMTLTENKINWEPTIQDVGLHNFDVIVTDGLSETSQKITLNVNDTPVIISSDSIKIMVGDTLSHFISAQDQNIKSEITYSIRTTINSMFLNAKTGEITWAPQIQDVGQHTVEVAVSDGFDTGTNAQTIQVYVSAYPKFLNTPPTEAFVGLEYKHLIKAQNGQGGSIPNEDVFVTIEKTTMTNLELDSTNFFMFSQPENKDIGMQTITLQLQDKDKNKLIQTFEVLVLESSPCDTEVEETEKIKERKSKKKIKLKRVYQIVLGVIGGLLIGENS